MLKTLKIKLDRLAQVLVTQISALIFSIAIVDAECLETSADWCH